MASEELTWRWLSNAGKPPMKDLHMQRVENPLTAAGPDVEGQYGACHFHIELKVLHDGGYLGTPEETGRLKFRTGQREWAKKRWDVGGIAYILVDAFGKKLYLIPGAFAMALDQISTVKTAYLDHLSIWTGMRTDAGRQSLFSTPLSLPGEARSRVFVRLQSDPQLLSAASRDGALAQALGSLPGA